MPHNICADADGVSGAVVDCVACFTLGCCVEVLVPLGWLTLLCLYSEIL